MSKEEIRRRYTIGTEVVMWGTDYPHPEGTWPHTLSKLQDDFRDVPVDDTADMLGGTAANVYGFDLEALLPIAAKIGPSPDLLGQDPLLMSDPVERRNARWWKAEYGVTPPA
jgi:hypothetical protein